MDFNGNQRSIGDHLPVGRFSLFIFSAVAKKHFFSIALAVYAP